MASVSAGLNAAEDIWGGVMILMRSFMLREIATQGKATLVAMLGLYLKKRDDKSPSLIDTSTLP
jgi:hypothetical protein